MNFKNKLITKVITIASIMITIVACSSGPKGEESILPVSTEVQCLEKIGDQTYRYLAWGIGWDNTAAENDALKAAVMAALGRAAVSLGATCPTLMNSDEFAKADKYIEKLYSSGKWKEYVQSTTLGRIDPDKRLRLPDNRVKIGVDVNVNVKRLREDLERDGIIKSMRIGW